MIGRILVLVFAGLLIASIASTGSAQETLPPAYRNVVPGHPMIEPLQTVEQQAPEGLEIENLGRWLNLRNLTAPDLIGAVVVFTADGSSRAGRVGAISVRTASVSSNGHPAQNVYELLLQLDPPIETNPGNATTSKITTLSVSAGKSGVSWWVIYDNTADSSKLPRGTLPINTPTIYAASR